MAAFEMVTKEFTAAALSNELRLGGLPGRTTQATEVIELSQSQAVTMDGIAGDVEKNGIAPLMRKLWLTAMQNMEQLSAAHMVGAIGVNNAFTLSRMSPEQRFSVFARGCNFKVSGLSTTLNRVRDFQKTMALLQAVSGNPILLQAFFKKYSPDKILAFMMKALGVNPAEMDRDAAEIDRIAQDWQEVGQMQAILGGGGQSPAPGSGDGNGGGAGLPNTGVPGAEIGAETNQLANPASGISGAG